VDIAWDLKNTYIFKFMSFLQRLRVSIGKEYAPRSIASLPYKVLPQLRPRYKDRPCATAGYTRGGNARMSDNPMHSANKKHSLYQKPVLFGKDSASIKDKIGLIFLSKSNSSSKHFFAFLEK
jgi:hypothetical protein